jgi:renalase
MHNAHSFKIISNNGVVEKRTATDVLIVGAGIAGLAAARGLARAGFSVRILEKSRGVAGRAATKRLANGAIVDYGAPFFTVRNEPLRSFMQTLERQNLLHIWQYGMQNWNSGSLESSPDGYPRYVAKNGITTLGKVLRDGEEFEQPLEIIQNALVSAVWSNHFGYRAVLENGDIHTARAVLVNAPAPQALALTRATLESQTYLALERVKFMPCWALILALKSAPKVDWQALKLQHPMLSWVSLEHSKRNSEAAMVIHASSEWSQIHLESSPHLIQAPLIEAIEEILGEKLEIIESIAHRWRYAQAVQPHAEVFIAQDNLVFCGDWCAPQGNARIETAFESGWAAASYLGKQLEQPLEMILAEV